VNRGLQARGHLFIELAAADDGQGLWYTYHTRNRRDTAGTSQPRRPPPGGRLLAPARIGWVAPSAPERLVLVG
jgi:hypothetical protein